MRVPAWELAESLLELPPRITWGALLALRPGVGAVQWSDGSRQRIPWPRVQAWCRRGWAVLHDARGPSRVRQLDLVPGSRAAARRVLARRAENRRKWAVRTYGDPGSDEA